MVGKLTKDATMSCSRLPALLGLSPWSTPNDELRKSYNALNGVEAPAWEPGEAADMGNLLEPIILQEVGRRLGIDVMAPSEPFHAFGTPLSGSLDAIGHRPYDARVIETDASKGVYVMAPTGRLPVAGRCAIECKLTSHAPEDAPAPHRGPIQLQGQMLCAGLSWGAVAVLYRGIELRIFVYERDGAMIAKIIEACHDFERRKHGPDWYVAQNPADAIRTWQGVDDKAPPVDLSIEAVDLMDEIVAARQIIKSYERVAEEASAALMNMLGNAEMGVATDRDGAKWTVRWPMRHYKASAAKTTPAKEAYSIRLKSLDIRVDDAAKKEVGA